MILLHVHRFFRSSGRVQEQVGDKMAGHKDIEFHPAKILAVMLIVRQARCLLFRENLLGKLEEFKRTGTVSGLPAREEEQKKQKKKKPDENVKEKDSETKAEPQPGKPSSKPKDPAKSEDAKAVVAADDKASNL